MSTPDLLHVAARVGAIHLDRSLWCRMLAADPLVGYSVCLEAPMLGRLFCDETFGASHVRTVNDEGGNEDLVGLVV